MTWRQIGTGASATTILTLLWLWCHTNEIVQLDSNHRHYTDYVRGWEVGNPSASLLLEGSSSHGENAPC